MMGGPHGLPCPSCRTPLGRAHQRHGLFACATCGGIWVDLGTSQRLAAAADPSVSGVAQHVSNQARHPNVPANVPGRPCPACYAPMRPTTFGSVYLDSCLAHGTWFDRDELTRVMAEVQARVPPAGAGAGAPPTARASSSGSGITGGDVALGFLSFVFEILDD